MQHWQVTAGEWFALVQHELLLFAAFFFILGALDELGVDLAYLWLRLSGRARTQTVDEAELDDQPLAGTAAVFIPAWRESMVIGPMLGHALAAWPQRDVRFYIGCYRNDPETLASAMVAARGDPRVRLVINDAEGPTCKADCLNRLYAALQCDEARSGTPARMVVMQDAEDMVDPAALPLLDSAIAASDFVQIPVLALPQTGSAFIAGHYADEFAESHAKAMVVRDALGGGIPGAGVGCAIGRDALSQLASLSQGGGPFAVQSLTEDYELGLEIAALGMRTRFLRARTGDGRLIATRSYFPARIEQAVRQKTRWVHGVSLQGWDRMGWGKGLSSVWMRLRDRRGPFAALLLAIAYTLVALTALGFAASAAGLFQPAAPSPLLWGMLWASTAAFIWRAAVRAAFTARDHGWREGLLAVLRIPVSNIIAIMAGRRAIAAYLGTLRGAPARWDKTEHRDHPALARQAAAA